MRHNTVFRLAKRVRLRVQNIEIIVRRVEDRCGIILIIDYISSVGA